MRLVLADASLVVQGRSYEGLPLLVGTDGHAVEPAQSFLWDELAANGRAQSDSSFAIFNLILSYHSQFSYYSTNSRLRLMRWTNFTEVKTTRQGYEAISPTGAEFADNFWLSWDERGPAHSIPFDTDSHHASVPPRFSADGRYLARTTLEGVILLVHREEVRRRFATLGFKVRP